jgi:hypothetical protein
MQVADAEVMGVSLGSVSWRTDGGCGSEYSEFFPWWRVWKAMAPKPVADAT